MSTNPASATAPVVTLKFGDADRIVAGHPWVYDGTIAKITGQPADGDAVLVRDIKNRQLGTGLWNSKSKIRVRVLTPENTEINRAFFEERIRAALALRQRTLPGPPPSFRVVNAEGDFLSGLIVDKYEDVLVLQTSSLGMDQRKDTIVAVLQDLLAPRAIVERNDIATRRFEGLTEQQGILAGSIEGGVTVLLNGLKFEVDLIGGHKTGLYLDQQFNQRLVADLIARIPGARVLDAFSFVGGFGLAAARAGAAAVHLLDQSEDAIAAARRHAGANGLEARCSFETANVFDWLKARTATGPHEKLIAPFEAIVLDPPSFTRNRAAVPDALRGYKEIHVRALKLLKRGGLLATFCCSHHVDAVTFQDVILSAAFDTRRVLRRVAAFTQSPDHPIIPSIPETEYLKGYAFEVVR